VNWAEVADGGWADNAAFSALSDAERLAEVQQAVAWASGHLGASPEGSQRVAGAALHLMDAYQLADPVQRAWLSFILGASAVYLGDMAGASALLRKLIDTPAPGTCDVRTAAILFYADAIRDQDPDQAIDLLRKVARSAVPADGSTATMDRSSLRNVGASAAVSLGALLRRRGEVNEARLAFEEGIASCDPATRDPQVCSLLARLHGNLGNLFFDQLTDYSMAAEHYAKSVDAFDVAGQQRNAAQRYLHLVDARLMGGWYAEALRLLRNGEHRVGFDLEMFRAEILDLAHWQDPDDPAAWEAYFTALSARHSAALTPSVQAALIAATIVLRKRMDDDGGAIRLAHDLRLTQVAASPLTNVMHLEVANLAQVYGCYGIMWPQLASDEELAFQMTDAQLEEIKSDFAAEAATIWLLDMARQATSPERDDVEFLTRVSGPDVVPGTGAVPAAPPAWLGPVDPQVQAAFARLRTLLPSPGEISAEAGELIDSSYGPDGRVGPGTEDQLRRAVHLADLLGDPGLQSRGRRALAGCVARFGRSPRERYELSMAILADAEAVALGLPAEQMLVHVIRSTIVKETLTGDQSVRLAAAIEDARRALSISTRRGYDNMVPACSLTLGNALAEHDGATLDQLREAVSVLTSGLDALHADPQAAQGCDESQLLNSLGMAHSKIGEMLGSAASHLTAIEHLAAALSLREQAGNADFALRTLSNLVAVHVRYGDLTGQDQQAETHDLADRALRLIPSVGRADSRCAALANLCAAYRRADIVAAPEVARHAVAAARELGPTALSAECLLNASRVFSTAADIDEARDLLTEATTVIEAVRLEAVTNQRRAELTELFDHAYLDLEAALERSGAPATDRWWTIERDTGRTILEGARHWDNGLDQVAVLAALGRLPDATVVLHTYIDSTGRFGYFRLRSVNGLANVQKGAYSVHIRDVALGMGGTFDGNTFAIPLYTPDRPADYARQLSWLGTHLLGPVLGELDLAGVTRIVVTSQGLGYVPWHAVPVPPGGTPLGATLEVVTVPSVTVLGHLLAEPSRPIAKAAFVACDPEGTLRQHITECRYAFAALRAPDKVMLTDTSRTVTKQAVRDLITEVDLFHYSGHSILVPGSPHKSGLLLSDGLLTVPELEQAVSRRAPALVFLSSCESGATDPTMRDAATLSSSLLQAGAHAVIGASWPVPDLVAARTAQVFYERFDGQNGVAALRQAHLQLMADPVSEADWAAFKFQGWL
jgi:tetratricopeptide (TPR) repeat protein